MNPLKLLQSCKTNMFLYIQCYILIVVGKLFIFFVGVNKTTLELKCRALRPGNETTDLKITCHSVDKKFYTIKFIAPSVKVDRSIVYCFEIITNILEMRVRIIFKGFCVGSFNDIKLQTRGLL